MRTKLSGQKSANGILLPERTTCDTVDWRRQFWPRPQIRTLRMDAARKNHNYIWPWGRPQEENRRYVYEKCYERKFSFLVLAKTAVFKKMPYFSKTAVFLKNRRIFERAKIKMAISPPTQHLRNQFFVRWKIFTVLFTISKIKCVGCAQAGISISICRSFQTYGGFARTRFFTIFK